MLPGKSLVKVHRDASLSAGGWCRSSVVSRVLALAALVGGAAGAARAAEDATWDERVAEANSTGDCARQWELALSGVSTRQREAWRAVDTALACYQARSCTDALGLLPDLPDADVQTWRRRGDVLSECAEERWRDAYDAYRQFLGLGGQLADVASRVVALEQAHLATLTVNFVASDLSAASLGAVELTVDGGAARVVSTADPAVRVLTGLEPGPAVLRLQGAGGAVVPTTRDVVLEPGSNALALALVRVDVPATDSRLRVRVDGDTSGWRPAVSPALAVPGTYAMSYGEGDARGVYAVDLLEDGVELPLPWAADLRSDGAYLWRGVFGPEVGAVNELRRDLPYPPTLDAASEARWAAEFDLGAEPGAYVSIKLDAGLIPGADELRELHAARRARKRSLAGAVAGYVVSAAALSAAGGLYGASLNQSGIAAEAPDRAAFDAATRQMQGLYAGAGGALGVSVAALGTAIGVDVHSAARKRRATAIHAAAVKTPLSLRTAPATRPQAPPRRELADDAIGDATDSPDDDAAAAGGVMPRSDADAVAPAATSSAGSAPASDRTDIISTATAPVESEPTPDEVDATPRDALVAPVGVLDKSLVDPEVSPERAAVAEPVALPPADASPPEVWAAADEGAPPAGVEVAQGAEAEVAGSPEVDPRLLPALRRRVDPRYPEVLRRLHGDRIIRCTGAAAVNAKGLPEGLELECPRGFHLDAAAAVSRWRWARHDGSGAVRVPVEVMFRKGRPTQRAGVTWIEDPEAVLGPDAPAQLRGGRMPSHPPQVSAGRGICVTDLVVSRRGAVRGVRVDGCARPYRKMAERAVRSWSFFSPGGDGAQVRVKLGFDI